MSVINIYNTDYVCLSKKYSIFCMFYTTLRRAFKQIKWMYIKNYR